MSNHNWDLLIQNGQVALSEGLQHIDIGIKDGKIVALGRSLPNHTPHKLDASDRLVFPGFIDVHTHMGIPIKDTISADDFSSGSIAAAFGGITTVLDFTVQQKGQSPAEALQVRKQKAISENCHVDYSFHVNLTDQPENYLDQIGALISQGFTSFKTFSTYREMGMMVTWEQFRAIAGKTKAGGLLLLHAEENELIETATKRNIAAGQSAIYHAKSRTAEAEARAVANAAQIAGELNTPLYIVHLSTQAGLEVGLEARKRGVPIYLETCPQYLLLNETKYLQPQGHYFITTPPLRTQQDSEALWRALAAGDINVVATDHCPFTRAQKDSDNGIFHQTPNGLAGVETLFPLLYTYGVKSGRISLQRLLQVLGQNPAAIFGFSDRKGEIKIGKDADLVIWNPEITTTIQSQTIHGNSDWSPYDGMEIAGKLEYTLLRGQILVDNETFRGTNIQGQLLLR